MVEENKYIKTKDIKRKQDMESNKNNMKMEIYGPLNTKNSTEWIFRKIYEKN